MSLASEANEKITIKGSGTVKDGFLSRGSVSSAIVAVCKATLGSGCLGLPYAMKNSGLLVSVSLLLFVGALTVLSLCTISKAVNATGKPTYEEIVYHLFGKKAAYAFEISMILLCFGSAVVSLISACDVVEAVFIRVFGENPTTWYGHMFVNRASLTALFTVLVVFPLSLFRAISSIRIVSFLGVLGVVFFGVCASYILGQEGLSPTLDTDKILYPQAKWGSMLMAINTFAFAFCSQPNTPQIYDELAPKTQKRAVKTFVISTIIALVVYLVMGVTGFLAMGADADSASFVNDLAPYVKQKHPDILVCASLAWMLISVLVMFPLNVYPMRTSIELFLDGMPETREEVKEEGSLTDVSPRGIAILLVITVLSYLVSILLPAVNSVLGLVGAVAASVISFICPALFILALEKPTGWNHLKYWDMYLMLGVGVLSLVLGTYLELENIVVNGL